MTNMGYNQCNELMVTTGIFGKEDSSKMRYDNVGLNTVHNDIKSIINLGMNRVELCLGRVVDKDKRMIEVTEEIKTLAKSNMKYSIHHPMFMYDYFDYDYLESFFLDTDPDKRSASLMLLEDNLSRMRSIIDEQGSDNDPDYVAIHFPGVYPEAYMDALQFDILLDEVLGKISELSLKYGFVIALEYFGSNVMFCDPYKWIDKIGKFKGLSILTDTGHLYFASIMRDFDFINAFKALAANSCGIHLWTSKKSKKPVEDPDKTFKEFSQIRPHYEIKNSKDVYGANEFYRKYHHVIVSLEQLEIHGWAFNSKEIVEIAINQKIPVILEATPFYGGTQYYLNAIKAIVKLAEENCDDK